MEEVQTIFRISDLIELSEKIYKKYGDIGVSIRVNENKLAPVRQVGVAGKDSKTLNADNMFMCFSPFILQDVGECKTSIAE